MRASLISWGLPALIALLPLIGQAESGGPVPAGVVPPHVGALSPEIPGLGADEIAGLRRGDGAGQARVAEVQGYPGPMHVLQASDAGQLFLSADQIVRVREIHQAMAREARRLGIRVLDAEQDLAHALRSGAIEEASLQTRVDHIAALRGELRAVHLRAHLRTRALLDPGQLARYAELRGYAPAGGQPGHRH
jgi:hypothetical protein